MGNDLDEQFLGLRPIRGDPVGVQRNANADQEGNAKSDDSDDTSQVTDGLGAVATAGEARHLTAQSGRHAHVDQAAPVSA